ncbi:hypothetical protein AFM11_20515 [Mycolicibacterium wolinskyi]|uniref:Uncharacterized protein MT0599 domain-containing protein n=1 Tax=Mycolicibacterium wolinskyi TaxID=59750 RepID=A0A132PK12_9MYCO|nr:hypothetical protein [Mycolicibacterium wolinskyi]KWX22527.1 hypothetical protein AFM11_20515 [Mycolicibacterium wolinskyi]
MARWRARRSRWRARRLERGAKIIVLTDNPHKRVTIVPACHIDSLDGEKNFFEDGDSLVGMVIEGGTVEYDAADRTYIVRLCGEWHAAD